MDVLCRKGYLVEECMTFCTRYLHDVELKLHCLLRNYDVSDNPEILMGRALGKGKVFVLDNTTWVQETKKNNGVSTSRLQVWMAACMKYGMSNSDSVNETQVNELTEHMEGSSTDPTALHEHIFTQVLGLERPGSVQTFGLGLSPTDVFGGCGFT
ncbi:unnamed protein product [Camellia sinensis]